MSDETRKRKAPAKTGRTTRGRATSARGAASKRANMDAEHKTARSKSAERTAALRRREAAEVDRQAALLAKEPAGETPGSETAIGTVLKATGEAAPDAAGAGALEPNAAAPDAAPVPDAKKNEAAEGADSDASGGDDADAAADAEREKEPRKGARRPGPTRSGAAPKAPDEKETPVSGRGRTRTSGSRQQKAGLGQTGSADAAPAGSKMGRLEEHEEATPAAMPQAAPMPRAAVLSGTTSLADTASPFGMAAATPALPSMPGLGILAVPDGLATPHELMLEMAEVAQIGMETNMAVAQALASARGPRDVFQTQIRSAQLLADGWMRQGARISELWLRMLPGSR